jgi:excisionase family DNA binding protein
MLAENVFTIEEVSQHLRVPEDAIRQEIAKGRLRVLDVAGFIRVRESDLNAYLGSHVGKDEAKTVLTAAVSELDGQNQSSSQLKTAPDFAYTWPAKKGAKKPVEQFTGVREGVGSYRGKEYHVKMGFTYRHSAGKRRRRSLVLVDRYATVEFVAADEKTTGKMASIIRDRNGKQLPVGATLPPEYQGLPVAPYSEVVVGAGASNGLAVVCESNDIGTMIRHALIRYRFREERP